MTKTLIRSALIALAFWHPGLPADLAREELLTGAFSGTQDGLDQVVQLQAKQTSFVAVYRSAQADPARGGLVLLHDTVTNADSSEVIRPLRRALADAGWDTLSLQLPVARRGERDEDWLERRGAIEARLLAGLDWLAQRGSPQRAIVAFGASASVALQASARRSPPPAQALILVSYPLAANAATDDLAALGRLSLPILDLYAERDHYAVLDALGRRAHAARASGRTDYRQISLSGAAAGFHGTEEQLASRVRAWLNASTDPAATRNTR